MLHRLLKRQRKYFLSTKVHIKEQMLNIVSKMVKVHCKSFSIIHFFNKVLCALERRSCVLYNFRLRKESVLTLVMAPCAKLRFDGDLN